MITAKQLNSKKLTSQDLKIKKIMGMTHNINHFQEIGWSDPNVLCISKPKFNLVSSSFNNLAYDVSKYNPH